MAKKLSKQEYLDMRKELVRKDEECKRIRLEQSRLSQQLAEAHNRIAALRLELDNENQRLMDADKDMPELNEDVATPPKPRSRRRGVRGGTRPLICLDPNFKVPEGPLTPEQRTELAHYITKHYGSAPATPGLPTVFGDSQPPI